MAKEEERTAGRAKAARGRPMAFDREAAVGAAMDTFWKYGFEAVSVSDLADAMAITRSSFYNTFGDRESAFREALTAYSRSAPDAALAEIGPDDPVVPAVRQVFRSICRARAGDRDARGCLVVNSIAELVGVNRALGDLLKTAVRRSTRRYEALIGQAVRRGEIDPPDDVETMARAFVVFVAGLNTMSKVIREEADLWRLCEDFLAGHGFAGAD